MKLKHFIAVLLLAAILWGVYAGLTNNSVTEVLPATSTNILTAYVGKPVFIEFMSPSCSHCVAMVPVLKQLYDTYGSKIVFLSIAYGSQAEMQQFIKTYDTHWTYLLDSSGQTFRDYGVTGTPTFTFIDSNGKVQVQLVGEMSYAQLAQAFDSL